MMRFFIVAGLVFLASGLIGCEGLSSFVGVGPKKQPLPIVFAATPSLEEIKAVINGRYGSVQSFESKNAVLSMSGLSLRACTIVHEKPNRLRVRGGLAVGLGTEVDFGCNGEHLWFWYKSNREKELYYAKLDQFATCPARDIIRIEPEWLLESLGLVELKDTDRHTAPERSPEGNLVVKSELDTIGGTSVRVLTIHPQTSALLQHEIYTADGRPFMVSRLSDHVIDPYSSVLYAKKIEVHMVKTGETFSIHLGTVQFNSPAGFSAEAFRIPVVKDYVPVDICSPEFLRRFQPEGFPADDRSFSMPNSSGGPAPPIFSEEAHHSASQSHTTAIQGTPAWEAGSFSHAAYPANPGYTPQYGRFARAPALEPRENDTTMRDGSHPSSVNTTYVRPSAPNF